MVGGTKNRPIPLLILPPFSIFLFLLVERDKEDTLSAREGGKKGKEEEEEEEEEEA